MMEETEYTGSYCCLSYPTEDFTEPYDRQTDVLFSFPTTYVPSYLSHWCPFFACANSHFGVAQSDCITEHPAWHLFSLGAVGPTTRRYGLRGGPADRMAPKSYRAQPAGAGT